MIFSNYRKTMQTAMAALMIVGSSTMISCDSMIYDDQGDCSVRYRVKLMQTINLSNADAFGTEVTSVSLFVFDQSGQIVTTKSASIDELSAMDNSMVIEVLPGKYDLIAWAKGDVSTPDAGGFEYASPTPTTKEDLCRILESHEQDGMMCSSRNLNRLYHAMANGVEFPDSYGTVDIEPLDFTKDTNTVTVMLQHYNKGVLNADDFNFTVTDANGKLDYDNAVMAGPVITYSEWNKFAANTEFDYDDLEGRSDKAPITMVSTVVGQLSLSRITLSTNPILRVTKKDGSEVLRLPLVQLALLVKGEYAMPMTDQDYLDRQDNYQLTFLLDDNNSWYSALGIFVNGWHRIIQNSDI